MTEFRDDQYGYKRPGGLCKGSYRTTDWGALLPEPWASHQALFERRAAVLRARRSGMGFRRIGDLFDVSVGRARQMARRAENETISPYEAYCQQLGGLLADAAPRVVRAATIPRLPRTAGMTEGLV